MAKRVRKERLAALAEAAGGAGRVMDLGASSDEVGSDMMMSDVMGPNPLVAAADLLEAALPALSEDVAGEVQSIIDRLRKLAGESLEGPKGPETAEPKAGTLESGTSTAGGSGVRVSRGIPIQ